jgi:hypothetical protein
MRMGGDKSEGGTRQGCFIMHIYEKNASFSVLS